MNRKALIALIAVMLAVLAGSLYSSAIDNGFIWDDPIVFSRQLPYFDSLKNVFMPPPRIPQFAGRYYRPIIVVTYQIDEWLAETFWDEAEREEARRITYHASVVVYNAIATVLVFFVGLMLHRASRAGPNPNLRSMGLAGSALGAILYAAHPIHVESVAWMAGRSDVICGIFFFAAVCFYLWAREGAKWALAGFGISALLSMLSKETGVGLILLIPALEFILPRNTAQVNAEEELSRAKRRQAERAKKLKRSKPPAMDTGTIARVGLLVLTVMVYLTVRGWALESMGGQTGALKFTQGLGETLQLLFGALGWFVWEAIWPPPQSAFIGTIPGGPHLILGIVVVLGSLGLWWRFRKSGFDREFGAVALFLAATAPSLAIAVYRISESPLAERYLYIPTAGSCLLFAFLLERLVSRLPLPGEAARVGLAAVLVAVIAIPAMAATRERTKIWKDDFTFWQETVKGAPNDGIPHLHLGMEYSKRQKYDLALESYQLAYENYAEDDYESRSKALNNMATVYMSRRQYDKAIERCKAALKMQPGYPTPYFNMAGAHRSLAARSRNRAERMQHLQTARSHYQSAIRLNPRYVKAFASYGELLAQLGEREEAKRNLQRAIDLAPTSASAANAKRVLAQLE